MNILRTFLFLCGAIGFCLSEEDDAKYRLPIEVIPYSYAIKLQPFIPEGYFKGEVYIKIGVTSPVDAIYLHASNLNISEIKIVGELENILFKIEEKYELIKIYYENGEKILVGDQMLHFIYEGTLLHTDQMGMVKAMYPFKNETEVLVITDFQPTYARRAYPCFDEPAMKAIFNVTIITPNSSWVALSNAEEISHEDTPEGTMYKFQSTPPMSTDVTSFAVTKMDFLENVYEDGPRLLTVRTFLANAKEENQTFVLNFAEKCVKYFEEFTKVKYPLAKIDFIEYDKKFTATEYWGLTTFKRGLLNPSLDLYDTRQISIVVAHELTHYWFGNLVSNKWWSDIWLQEGFAQYLSHKAVDAILNTTNVEEYPLDYTMEVFREDRDSENVNPVVTNCTTPSEIMVQFNDITYIKSGSLIRLLDYVVGKEGFEKIIRKYFEQYSYKSANTEDFITTVESVIPDKNMRDFLETWLLQNRYPIISIEEDIDKNTYILRQESASNFKDTDNMSRFGYKWTIPIIYTTSVSRAPTMVWFRKDDNFITIPKGNETFIKLNYNYMGIYYTNYTPTLWQNLVDNVEMMNELEQVQLALEAEKLFEADVIDCGITLKLISKVSSEPNQYGVSPLSILFTLRNNLAFDQRAISLLRRFYFSIRVKSKMMRREEEKLRNSVKKIKREASLIDTNVTQSSHESSMRNATLQVEAPPKKPLPRYMKCAKWIHENLSYLM